MTEERLMVLLNRATDDACMKKDEASRAVKRRIQTRQKKLVTRPVLWASAAAAVIIVCFMGFTEPGRALAASILSLFAPEKPVTMDVEGYSEEKTAILAPDSSEHYAFYYDETQFERLSRNDADMLLARDQDEHLPEVSLSIRRVEGASAQALYESARTPESIDLGAVTSPVVGYGMETWRGQEWNAPVTVIYWLDDGFGNAYEFTLSAFTEAYEGYIQRMKQMLTTFTIVQ